MVDELSHKMHARLRTILKAGLFYRAGTASNYDFVAVCKSFKSFRIVPSRNIALFEQGSRAWASAIFAMENDMYKVFKSMKEKTQLENFIFETKPGLVTVLDSHAAESSADNDLFDNTLFLSISVGYAREVFLASTGHQVDGAFDDLFKIYEIGFLPCGFDGIFPHGELLIF